ncbi:Serine/threonine-protein kinase PknB [Enhygromyxa salina]|uniref:Serine/threonine-protein kinase PknB n=1 Tax=Enhygromyxa salina TaxID=215803 RepID=A0A0C2CXQ2_9BACT|nr:serine/threonine-protein kinase [Enhygromyxa salina]KIG14420.1 Serine/threonine-protein kinase PknB [Enhygromyxa salina]
MQGDDHTLPAALLQTLGPFADAIQRSPKSTIRPAPADETAGTRGRRAVAALVEQAGALGDLRREVELGETLGEGGMGIVRHATQRSMGRPVAVKTARVHARSEATTLKLLREAWVTGALEHPNIVPIYDVGLDPDGAPVIMMRLVDGNDWGSLMRDEQAVREQHGSDELLDWNLRIFLQVCNAARFAHSRGIIHRDLKPENVMIGRFGQVYLLDWGIAVSLEDDGSGRFPLAREVDQTVGTPAYMAPEMLSASASALGVQTDVYLLGAILYEIIEGTPPHRCESLTAFVDSVVESSPRFVRGMDDELRAVCCRAMARSPQDRYADVAALQGAIEAYLRHRGSRRLAHEARERLVALEATIARQASNPTNASEDDLRLEVHDLFAACRFGFQAALDRWTDNPEARQGTRELLTLVARYELDHGEHRAASLLLAELHDPPAELVTALELAIAASEADREEVERLRKFGDDHDARIGQRTRWFALVMLGTCWSGLPLVLSRWPPPSDLTTMFSLPALFVVIMVVVMIWGRESLAKTAFNRKAASAMVFSIAAPLVLILGGILYGFSVELVLLLQLFLWFVCSAMITILLDPRLWPAAVGYGLGFLAVAWTLANWDRSWDPTPYELSMCIMSASHAVLTLTLFVVWRPESFRRVPNELRSG